MCKKGCGLVARDLLFFYKGFRPISHSSLHRIPHAWLRVPDLRGSGWGYDSFWPLFPIRGINFHDPIRKTLFPVFNVGFADRGVLPFFRRQGVMADFPIDHA